MEWVLVLLAMLVVFLVMGWEIVEVSGTLPLVINCRHIQQINTPRIDQAAVRTQFDLTSCL
jgi:hypothetical protein